MKKMFLITFFLMVIYLPVKAAPNCNKYQCITCVAKVKNVGELTYYVKSDGKENITVTHTLKRDVENSAVDYDVIYDNEYFYSKQKDKLVCPSLGYLIVPSVGANRVTKITMKLVLKKPQNGSSGNQFSISTSFDNKKPYREKKSAKVLKCQYDGRVFISGRATGSVKLTIVNDGTNLKYNFGNYKVGQINEASLSMFQSNSCPKLAMNCNVESKTCNIYKELNDPISNAENNKPQKGKDPINADDLERDNAFCKRYDCMPSSSVDPSASAALKRSTCEIINVNTDLGRFLNKMVNYIRIGVIFLVLVLGMVDLMGAVGASEEGAFEKAGTRFFKRLIAAALVFLVPAIVNILISLINDASCAGDPNYDPTGGIFDNHA